MKIENNQIKRIADLSRIEISEGEMEKFASQFSNILTFVNQINEVNTEGVKVTYEVTGSTNVFRADEIRTDYFNKEILLQNTPILDGTKIVVPAVFGEKNDY